ncbi:MAG: thioredoxin family protein [Gammaproteobacteria bacterium]|nr:thioredoxin family protein [Gammaproteobacteria bacterium]
MSRTPSTMLEIGTQAPNFELPEAVSGHSVSLADFTGKPLLVVFSCNHCPYVIHILKSFTEYANAAQRQGISVVMINANDVDNYPADSPEKMLELSGTYGFEFPYLYDQSQSTAIAYEAACTPDFFLFNHHHELVYRGQYDTSRPGNHELVSGADLKAATQALLSGDALPVNQLPSMGCNIKWREGNEPTYF